MPWGSFTDYGSSAHQKNYHTDSLFLNELGVSNKNIDAEMYERMLDKLINSHPSKIT